jgi:hypothetical protein
VDRIQSANGAGEWQDPDVLDTLVAGATRVTLTEGETRSVRVRVIGR